MVIPCVPVHSCRSSSPSCCREEFTPPSSLEALHRDVLAVCPSARRRSDGWLTGITVTFEALDRELLIPVLWIRNRTCPLFVAQVAGNVPQVGETWTGCEIDTEGFIYPVYPPGVMPGYGG